MDYDRDMGHSLQIYLLCAAIHLMSIISLAFTYHNELQLILHMHDNDNDNDNEFVYLRDKKLGCTN